MSKAILKEDDFSIRRGSANDFECLPLALFFCSPWGKLGGFFVCAQGKEIVITIPQQTTSLGWLASPRCAKIIALDTKEPNLPNELQSTNTIKSPVASFVF